MVKRVLSIAALVLSILKPLIGLIVALVALLLGPRHIWRALAVAAVVIAVLLLIF